MKHLLLFFFTLSLLISLLACLLTASNNFNEVKKTSEKIPYANYDDSLLGKISNSTPLRPRSYYSICTIDKRQRVILPWAENYNYAPKHLFKFLQENDSIYKPRNTDTLYIYRNKEEFYFILQKRIVCNGKV